MRANDLEMHIRHARAIDRRDYTQFADVVKEVRIFSGETHLLSVSFGSKNSNIDGQILWKVVSSEDPNDAMKFRTIQTINENAMRGLARTLL
jgi:hypothetical protein